MNKILRYSFIALLALVCNVTFGQTKFDFNNDYATLFPSLKGLSSSTSSDGDFTEATSCTVDGIKVTISAKATSAKNPNRIWSSKPRLRMYSGTITVEAPQGKTISEMTFDNGKWNENNKVDNGSITNKGVWTGDANKVVITISANTQINALNVLLKGETISYTDVSSVKDLLANYSADQENLNLKLTNAKVLYVNEYNGTVNTYVREGDAAIELRTLGFDMPVNSVINGAVKVDLAYSYGIPYLKANVGTDNKSLTVTESTEAAEPITATVADILANKYMNDLVIIKDFTFSKSGSSYYANDGDSKIILYDKFSKVGGVANLTDGEKYTVVGLFGAIYNKVQEIIPIKSIAETSGISNITIDDADANAPVYNLAGQKVSTSYKGVVIKAGKKFVQK